MKRLRFSSWCSLFDSSKAGFCSKIQPFLHILRMMLGWASAGKVSVSEAVDFLFTEVSTRSLCKIRRGLWVFVLFKTHMHLFCMLLIASVWNLLMFLVLDLVCFEARSFKNIFYSLKYSYNSLCIILPPSLSSQILLASSFFSTSSPLL